MKTGKQGELDRRGFVRQAGLGAAGLAGAAILPAAARAAAGDPVIDFARLSCGDAGPRILVGYASMCGSTGEIAAAIGKKLCAAGARADVRHLPDVTDLAGYSAFVIGSPIHGGMWMNEAMTFIRANQDALAQAPVAYFIACMAMATDSEGSRKMAKEYVGRPLTLVPKIKPVALGTFAGKVDYAKMPKRYEAVMRRIVPRDQDSRDWQKIDAWGAELAGQLIKA